MGGGGGRELDVAAPLTFSVLYVVLLRDACRGTYAWWVLASMLELLPRPLPCAVFFLWSVMLICVAVTTAYNAPIGIKYKPEAFVVSLRSAHGKF